MSVTIAICTRNRTAQLRRALQALATQAVPPAEVLVVDNAPTDEATRELVRREFPSVRYAREPVPGLDFARNHALRAATSDVVAFIDDDVVVDREWTRAVSAVFEGSRAVGACTGRVEPLAVETAGQRLIEANGGYGRGGERVRLPADARRALRGLPAPLVAWTFSVGSGCSLAVRRDLALELGGFDEALDLGPALPGGGDHDMLWRVLGAGFDVVYEPAALALHEHRRELRSARDQIVGHQHAMIAVLTKIWSRSRGSGRLAVSAFLVWRLLKPGLRVALRVLRRDPLPVPLLLRMWWQCCLGLTGYRRGRDLARRRVLEHGGRL